MVGSEWDPGVMNPVGTSCLLLQLHLMSWSLQFLRSLRELRGAEGREEVTSVPLKSFFLLLPTLLPLFHGVPVKGKKKWLNSRARTQVQVYERLSV